MVRAQPERVQRVWHIAIAAHRPETGHALAGTLQAGGDNYSIALLEPPIDHAGGFGFGEPDLLLVHNELIEEPVESSLKPLLKQYSEMRVLVFGADLSHDYRSGLVRAGVHGYFDTETDAGEIQLAVQQLLAGYTWMEQRVIGDCLSGPGTASDQMAAQLRSNIDTLCEQLTRREKEILCQVIRGYAIKQIAAEVHLSHQGVKMHLARLFRKFGASNRNQLILAVLDRISPVKDLSLALCNSLRNNLIEKTD
jgi:DNA-binding NarL/FixJ family response regulator